MCLGTPVRIVALEGVHASCEDRHGQRSKVDLLLVGTQPAGTWVLSFKHSARRVMDADEAAQVGEALDALQALLNGDAAAVETAFADLIGREPTLPDFLAPGGNGRPT